MALSARNLHQSSSRCAGFGPRLPGLGTAGAPFAAGEKAIVAERSADAFGGAQPVEQARSTNRAPTGFCETLRSAAARYFSSKTAVPTRPRQK